MQESDGADGRHNRKQATPPEGNPRRGGFSLSVGKYAVKGVRRKKECLDLCCKYTCLRHIGQYAEGIIRRNLGCAQLRWQNQRMGSRSPAGPRRLRKRTYAVNAPIRFLRLCCIRPQAPYTETPRVCPREPLCGLLRGRAASQPQRRISSRFWADLSKLSVRRKRSRRKALALFCANAHSQQPAVRAAARVCGFWKLTLFSRFPEQFDAKFKKSSRRAP